MIWQTIQNSSLFVDICSEQAGPLMLLNILNIISEYEHPRDFQFCSLIRSGGIGFILALQQMPSIHSRHFMNLCRKLNESHKGSECSMKKQIHNSSLQGCLAFEVHYYYIINSLKIILFVMGIGGDRLFLYYQRVTLCYGHPVVSLFSLKAR